MDWADSWRGAFRIELRAEAIGFASRGWPVLAGTYPARSGWAGAHGEPATGLAPIEEGWRGQGQRSPERVAALWDGHPYSLLAATGTVFDAIETSDRLGRAVAAELRLSGGPVPIVATPDGRWLFVTEPGHDHRILSGLAEVAVRGEGDWIPLPPTPYEHGIAHWRVKPEICGWRLPAGGVVQGAVLRAVRDRADLAAVNSNARHAALVNV